jgi:hypothetical protein
LPDDRRDRAGNVIRQRRALLLGDALQVAEVALAGSGRNRWMPGQQRVQGGCEPVNVRCGRRQAVVAEHLRGGVRGGGGSRGEFGRRTDRDPEVRQGDHPEPVAEHVVRLDVAMQDSGLVCGVQGLRDCAGDGEDVVEGQPPVRMHGRRQGPVLEVRHHQVRTPVGREPAAEDGHDVRVVTERPQDGALAGSPGGAGRRPGRRGRP